MFLDLPLDASSLAEGTHQAAGWKMCHGGDALGTLAGYLTPLCRGCLVDKMGINNTPWVGLEN